MTTSRFTGFAMALGIALTLAPTSQVGAQTEPTRRAVSEKRIPVSKEQESRGEVALSPEAARVTTLETSMAELRQRIESLESEMAATKNRSLETERTVNTLKESLRSMNEELTAARAELANTTARTNALADSLYRMNRSLNSLRYGSLFGHSGFYIGLGTGANFTTSTLRDMGYTEGLNLTVPIGWSKPGTLLGLRAEFAMQQFEGRIAPTFVNPDPTLYSATAMATLNLPMNAAKTNLFYLMGGGGAYNFRSFGSASALNDRLGGTAKNVTKLGVTAGAGFEFHILGATSLFLQSQFTNVFADKSETNLGGGRNLRWMPFVAGLTLR